MSSIPDIPWTPIIFFLGQAIAFGLWLIKLGKKTDEAAKDIQALTIKVNTEMAEMQRENAELKRELREIRDILIQVKQATDLLMLGRIKTGNKEAI